MSGNYDFIIVGGGMAGASVGAALTAHGSVLVLEAEPNPGMHATGRSAAFYSPGYGEGAIRTLTLSSEPFLKAGEDGASFVRRRGGLFIASHEQSALLDAYGQSPVFERLGSGEVLQMLPILKQERIAGGLYDKVGADIDVDLLHKAYLRALKRGGGAIACDEAFSAAEPEGQGWRVKTSRRSLQCAVLVNAGGAWADEVAAKAGLEPLGLQPKRRTAALVEAPPAADFERWPAVLDIEERFYFKPDAGLLLVSPADETDVPPHDAYADDLALAEGIERIRDVAELEVRRAPRSWAGLRTFAPDRKPVFGRDPRSAAAFVWCAGQGGYGIQTAPAAAQLTASLAAGETAPPFADAALLAEVSPERLAR